MMDINFSENFIPIKICDNNFLINGDDLKIHQVLSDFIEKYKGNRFLTTNFIDDCRSVINTILGDDAYQKIFTTDDLKPYYLILRLNELVQDNFIKAATTEKMIDDRNKTASEMHNVQTLLKDFSEFTKQMNYAESKYGFSDVVNKKRSSKKYHSQ